MVDIDTFKQLAVSFPGAIELPHFEKTSFRVRKKIFATLDEKTGRAVVKLSATDQSVFCAFDKNIVYPVPGGWGKQGWTIAVLPAIKQAMLKDLLTVAYCTVAPKQLAEKYRQP